MENKDFLNIFIFSDPHGGLPKIESPFDLLLIGGDVSPAHDHYYSFQKEWFMTDFADWINSLPFNPDPLFEPFSKVVMIGGNHDCFLERITKHEIAEFNKKTGNRVVILKNEEYDWEYLDDNGINSLKIFGTPYCKIFGNWSFMVNNDKLKEKYSKMPYNCDILLSHDAPDINGLGMICNGYYRGTNAGNVILANEIMEKKPRFVFCGHIHSGNHNLEQVDNIWMANVSYVDERYEPYYPNEMGILKIKLDLNAKELIKNNMENLETTINKEIGNAMKEKNSVKLSALRAVKTAIQNEKTNGTFHELTDKDVIKIIQKQIKQRIESEEIYRHANRNELADNEKNERIVLEEYIPKALTDDEIKTIIDSLVAELNVSSIKDMGKIMKVMNEKYAGRFDGKTVSQMIKEKVG